MKYALVAAAVVLTCGYSDKVMAQELPRSSWSGCYVGANAGYGHAISDATDLPFTKGLFGGSGFSWNGAPGGPYETVGMDSDSLIGGLEAGCDTQLNNSDASFVVGGVIDFSFMNGGATRTSSLSPDTHTSFDVDLAGSARLRAGVAASDFLFYVTGGYAFGGVDVRAFDRGAPGLMDVSGGGTESGWVAGGGVEWRVQPALSVGLEYLHYDFGTVTATGRATFPVEAFPRFENEVTLDVVRIGLKWRM
jgi:opacity protein-like surface antigen